MATTSSGSVLETSTEKELSKPPVNSSVDSLLGGMDKGMLLRMTYVLVGLTIVIVLYFIIKMWRMKRRVPIRHYDALSAKQLQPELVVDSESEDELFANDDHQHLMPDARQP